MATERKSPYLAPRLAILIVVVDFCGYSAFGLLQMFQSGVDAPRLVSGVAAMAALLSLQLLYFHRSPDLLCSQRTLLVLAVQALLAYLPLVWLGQAWMGMPSFLAGSVLLVLPARPAWTLFAAIVLSTALIQPLLSDSVLDVAYTGVSTAMFGLAVYGLLRLSRLATELYATRSDLARGAVIEERLRFARDLHDLLGLGLSAIALKSELAHRLIGRDPARAMNELTDILDVSRRALADVRSAVVGYHELSLEAECRSAELMLSSAGMDARITFPERQPTAQVSTVVATVLREAVTNVLRHSKGKWCSITVRVEAETMTLEVVNDGVGKDDETGPGGNGLKNLAYRVAALDGELTAGPLSGGRFRLHASVPLSAQPLPEADPVPAPSALPAPGDERREIELLPPLLLTAVLWALGATAGVHVLYRVEAPVDMVLCFLGIGTALWLQLGFLSNPGPRQPARPAYLALGLLAAVVLLPPLVFGPDWVSMLGLLAGSALLVLPPAWGWLVFVAVAAGAGWERAFFGGSALDVAFIVISTLVNGLIVFGLTWLSGLLTELDATRTQLARRAVAGERLRFARGVHDLLGLSLSAISLKGELTRRLITTDVTEAERKLLDIQGLARQALADVRSVTSSYRDLSLDEELRLVESLLDAAGVSFRSDMHYGELRPPVRTLLAALLREGVANALRHSGVRRCEIAIRQQGGTVSLDIVNDGTGSNTEPESLDSSADAALSEVTVSSSELPEDGATGSAVDGAVDGGIRKLAGRVRELGGELSAGPLPGGRFRLRATMPAGS